MNLVRAAASAALLATAANLGLAADPPEPVVLEGHTEAVSTVAWAADGKTVATASDDRTIRLWDPQTGRQTAILTEIAPEGRGDPVVAFTADLKVAAINYWGEITIRSVPEGEILAAIDAIPDHKQYSTLRPDVLAMAFSPDGKWLATAGQTRRNGLPAGVVITWDAATGKIEREFDRLSWGSGAVAWSPDGKLIAAGTDGFGSELPEAGEVKVWDAQTGKTVHRFDAKFQVAQGEWVSVGDVAFLPDGERVAFAAVNAAVRSTPYAILKNDGGSSVWVWNLNVRRSSQPVKGLRPSISRVAFSPDGKRLAMAGGDEFVRVWDVEAEKELAALPCPARVAVVAYSPDGRSLLAGCRDGSARIWAAPVE